MIVYGVLGFFALIGFGVLIVSILDNHNKTTPKEEIERRKEKEAQLERKYKEIKEEKAKEKAQKKEKKKEQNTFDMEKKKKAKELKSNQSKKDFFSWLKPKKRPIENIKNETSFNDEFLNTEEQKIRDDMGAILEKIEKL